MGLPLGNWCCSCTQHSTCLMLGPSSQACDCQNARRKCTDCVCWLHIKNSGAFLPRKTGEGLYGHSHVAVPAQTTPPANPLHHRAPLAAHGTGGGRRGEGEDYFTEEDIKEGGGENRGGDTDGTLGDGNGTSSASSTGDDKSLMEGTDGTLGEAEDSG